MASRQVFGPIWIPFSPVPHHRIKGRLAFAGTSNLPLQIWRSLLHFLATIGFVAAAELQAVYMATWVSVFRELLEATAQINKCRFSEYPCGSLALSAVFSL